MHMTKYEIESRKLCTTILDFMAGELMFELSTGMNSIKSIQIIGVQSVHHVYCYCITCIFMCSCIMYIFQLLPSLALRQ